MIGAAVDSGGAESRRGVGNRDGDGLRGRADRGV